MSDVCTGRRNEGAKFQSSLGLHNVSARPKRMWTDSRAAIGEGDSHRDQMEGGKLIDMTSVEKQQRGHVGPESMAMLAYMERCNIYHHMSIKYRKYITVLFILYTL